MRARWCMFEINPSLILRMWKVAGLHWGVSVKVKVLVAQSWLTLYNPIVCPWNSPGKNTGLDCHFLLQGIFPTHGLNLGLLHWRQSLSSELPAKPWGIRLDTKKWPLEAHWKWASVVSNSVWPHIQQPTRLRSPWDFSGKNTGVGCHCLLQCMKVKVKSLSHVRPSATPWTAACQAPPSMGFSRQECWSGVPLLPPNIGLGEFKKPSMGLYEIMYVKLLKIVKN